MLRKGQTKGDSKTITHIRRFMKVKVVQSCLTLSGLMDCKPARLFCPWNSPGQETEMGSCFLLCKIFPTQGSNPGLLHCQRILYHLSHQGCPRILKWLAYSFSGGSSWLRNWTGVFWIASGFFTSWAGRCIPIHKSLLESTPTLKSRTIWVPIKINRDCCGF